MEFEGGGSCPHGTKRRAEEELANDQRLIKRFNLLSLGEALPGTYVRSGLKANRVMSQNAMASSILHQIHEPKQQEPMASMNQCI